jgi:hypothetical protein
MWIALMRVKVFSQFRQCGEGPFSRFIAINHHISTQSSTGKIPQKAHKIARISMGVTVNVRDIKWIKNPA